MKSVLATLTLVMSLNSIAWGQSLDNQTRESAPSTQQVSALATEEEIVRTINEITDFSRQIRAAMARRDKVLKISTTVTAISVVAGAALLLTGAVRGWDIDNTASMIAVPTAVGAGAVAGGITLFIKDTIIANLWERKAHQAELKLWAMYRALASGVSINAN